MQIAQEAIIRCQKLVSQFYLYVMLTKSLTKAFLSIKGIYYQANILGVPITWIQPYKYTPKVLIFLYLLASF